MEGIYIVVAACVGMAIALLFSRKIPAPSKREQETVPDFEVKRVDEPVSLEDAIGKEIAAPSTFAQDDMTPENEIADFLNNRRNTDG